MARSNAIGDFYWAFSLIINYHKNNKSILRIILFDMILCKTCTINTYSLPLTQKKKKSTV